MSPVKLLHFADAHIDAVKGGKQDPETGRPYHANDFLNALDQIVDTAIAEKVQLVLFAGDAFMTTHPDPTYQREWGRRLMRLSAAQIQTVLIAGNHDAPNADKKATTLHEIETWQVPNLHLAGKAMLYRPADLGGLPIQVLAVPWISSKKLNKLLMKNYADYASLSEAEKEGRFFEEIGGRIRRLIDMADPELPLVLLTHYTVAGAQYQTKKFAMFGQDLAMTPNMLCDPAFSYVALGHIHVFQDLNQGNQPPVIYSGSIERVDYGEADDPKGFVLAEVENHHAAYEFRKIQTRPMFNLSHRPASIETLQEEAEDQLRPYEKWEGAMIRLNLTFPREWNPALDEKALQRIVPKALELRVIRSLLNGSRIRFEQDEAFDLTALPPMDLVETYCKSKSMTPMEIEKLRPLAEEIIAETV